MDPGRSIAYRICDRTWAYRWDLYAGIRDPRRARRYEGFHLETPLLRFFPDLPHRKRPPFRHLPLASCHGPRRLRLRPASLVTLSFSLLGVIVLRTPRSSVVEQVPFKHVIQVRFLAGGHEVSG